MRFAWLALLCLMLPLKGFSQTPSPLQEWQYSGGTVLERMFSPDLPEWRYVFGVAGDIRPLYEGADTNRTQAGPVINVRYKDLAFASIGEGLGVNVLHGVNYRAGVALSYDLGRHESDDVSHLHGLPDIPRTPNLKLFVSYAVSKQFPMVVRADVRTIVTGGEGVVGDVGVYVPLPGSSRKLIMFAGPSITLADRRYMQKTFGITESEALASGYPAYSAHGGDDAEGFGFSATYFLTDHWFVNSELAVSRLLGSAQDSPITQRSTQKVLAISFAYSWIAREH